MKEKERYFACSSCCHPITWAEILEECESGGQGMCYCKFNSMEWSDEYQKFEPVYDRVFVDYIEITKVLYNSLKEMSLQNRLMHAYIPESQKIKEPIYCERCKGEIKNEK